MIIMGGGGGGGMGINFMGLLGKDGQRKCLFLFWSNNPLSPKHAIWFIAEFS